MVEVFGDSSRNGDWACVRLRLDGDRIVEADADGVEAPLEGLTLLEAAAVGGETLPVDALANAIGPVFRAPRSAERVAVAMSGGVDSAVALLRAGEDAIGVTLRLWLDPAGPDAERACCSPEAVIAARATCHGLGLAARHARSAGRVPRLGRRAVRRRLRRGETPNPCIRCNGSFRFAELLAFARRAGAARLATGHYARVVNHRGRRLLARAHDQRKDQSYMLAGLDPAELESVWFPLGDQTKEETRAEAIRAGLDAAHRPESQEACFLAGADYRDFLGRAGLTEQRGEVVDEDGHRLGTHSGHWGFTPGQRRGIGVAAGKPLHVLRTEPAHNRVVVGDRSALARTDVHASGSLFCSVDRAQAKLRYRSPAVSATVRTEAGGFGLDLDEPAYGVAPGQAAVLYEDDAVVGSGIIRR